MPDFMTVFFYLGVFRRNFTMWEFLDFSPTISFCSMLLYIGRVNGIGTHPSSRFLAVIPFKKSSNSWGIIRLSTINPYIDWMYSSLFSDMWTPYQQSAGKTCPSQPWPYHSLSLTYISSIFLEYIIYFPVNLLIFSSIISSSHSYFWLHGLDKLTFLSSFVQHHLFH